MTTAQVAKGHACSIVVVAVRDGASSTAEEVIA
jgi:hypothetical protein